MADKPTRRRRTAKHARGASKSRRHVIVARTESVSVEFNPRAPIRETDSEDAGGAYDSDRGETDLMQP
ncbi:MAG: hypothetical protein ACHQ2Z_15565 [Elusimicrobiota bacterium]